MKRAGKILAVITSLIMTSHFATAAALYSIGGNEGDTLVRTYDLSEDGSVIGGCTADSSDVIHATKWRITNGRYVATRLDNSSYPSLVNALSADGNIAVGFLSTSNGYQAVMWQGTNLIVLGDLPGGELQGEATAVSANGLVVAGNGRSDMGTEGFVWTAQQGMIGIGDLPGGGYYSRVYAISGDGTTAVGASSSDNGLEAFSWNQASGIIGLGDLPGGDFNSAALAVSFDGTSIAGFGDSPACHGSSFNGSEACIWTAELGVVPLGDIPGWIFESAVTGCGSNGFPLVGETSTTNGLESAIWINPSELYTLGQYASAFFGLKGVVFSGPTHVSRDGSSVLGEYGWLLSIQAPTSLHILGLVNESFALSSALTFQSDSQKNYCVMLSTNLLQDHWSDVTNFSGTGLKMSVTLPPVSTPSAFFRMRQE